MHIPVQASIFLPAGFFEALLIFDEDYYPETEYESSAEGPGTGDWSSVWLMKQLHPYSCYLALHLDPFEGGCQTSLAGSSPK